MLQVHVNNRLLVSFAEETFQGIAEARAELLQKTGKDIDEYGTTTLESAHCRLLAALIRSHQPSGRKESPEVGLLLAHLDAAAEGGDTLLFEGE